MNDHITLLDEQIKTLKDHLEALDLEKAQLLDKASKMAAFNEEMRDLITREREAYEEEQSRQDEEILKVRKQYEGRQKLMKNRLLMAIGATENMELEEAVKVAAEMISGGGKIPMQSVVVGTIPTQGSFHGESASPIMVG